MLGMSRTGSDPSLLQMRILEAVEGVGNGRGVLACVAACPVLRPRL